MQKPNPSQQQAIDYDQGHLLIVAGPGTGKTHALTLRIVKISEKLCEQQKILAITFTNKAAREMQERLFKLLSEGAHVTSHKSHDTCGLAHGTNLNIFKNVTVGTFHSFCLQFLRDNHPSPFTLASEKEIKELSKELWKGETKKQIFERLKRISFWKASHFEEKETEEVRQHKERLCSLGLFDYDDLLIETIKIFRQKPKVLTKIRKKFPFIFVDEYQDINLAQNVLLRLLSGEKTLVTAIGDPQQAIYGFRGSDMSFFQNFEKDFQGAEIRSLSENYRSTPNLLKASSQVMEKQAVFAVPELTAKIYEQGDLVVYAAPTDKAEAEYVVHTIERLIGGTSMFSHDSRRADSHSESLHGFGDIAVFYRLNAQNRLLKEAFLRSGIPFQIAGETPLIEQEGVQEFMGSLKEANKKKSFFSRDFIDQVIQNSTWNFKIEKDPKFKQRVKKLKRMALRAKSFQGFLDDILLQKPEDEGDHAVERVSLMTLHSSKGLEFPVVFIAGCEEGLIPYEGNEDVDEERRLFYVGMTRAKQKLFLTSTKKRMLFGKTKERKPSVFLSDIQEDLKRLEEKRQPKKKKPKQKQIDLFG